MCDGRGCKREATIRASLRGTKLGERLTACDEQERGGTTTGDTQLAQRAEAGETQPAKLVSTLKTLPERQRVVLRGTAGAEAKAAEIDRTEMLLHLLLWGPN